MVLCASFAAYTCIVPIWWRAYDGPLRRDGFGPGFAIPASWWRVDMGLVHTDAPTLQRRIREHASEPQVLVGAFASYAAHLNYKVLGIRPNDVILDIGAGNGGLELRLLADKVPFRKLFTTDTDPRAVALLQFILDTVHLDDPQRVVPTIVPSAAEWPLPSASVDLGIVVSTPLACNDHDRDLVLEVRRIMKRGGRFHYLIEWGREQSGPKACRPQDIVANLAVAGFRLQSSTVTKVVHVSPPTFPWTLLPPPANYLSHLEFRVVDVPGLARGQ